MSRFPAAWRLVRRVALTTPGLRAILLALRNYVVHQSANQAVSLAFSSVLATLWTASSGMQAVRSALNRAYGIEKGLPFWKARLKVTLFTIVVGTGVLAAFSSVVVMPYVCPPGEPCG